MIHKNFLIYIPNESGRKNAIKQLKTKYKAKNSIYQLNDSPVFCLKTESGTSLHAIMKTVGFNEENKVVGFVQDMSSNQNGWFNDSLWEWLGSSLG